MIIIKHIFSNRQEIFQAYPNAIVIDVTSHSSTEFVRMSPFYPHGDIPVPFSPGITSMSVEGIWQGLKVFEHEDIDTDSFSNESMRNIKRMKNWKRGGVVGHRKGLSGEIIGYVEARKEIYLPTYQWMLENKCRDLIEKIRKMSLSTTVVLLDFDCNADVYNTRQPLSHAALIKSYIDSLK